MTNVARLTDPERIALVKQAYNLCNSSTIDWISALEIAQEKLFPLEKRYAKATLKCKSNVFVDLLKKENINFDPIAHNNKIIESQFNTSNNLKYNPTFFNASEKRFGFPNIQSSVPFPPMSMHRPEFNQNTFHNTQQKPAPFNNLKPHTSAPPISVNNFTFGNKINELASYLAKQFETQLTTELDSALNTALGNVERNFAKKLDDARKITGKIKQLPKVMIFSIGSFGAFQIEGEYGEILDIRYYTHETDRNIIKSQSKHCDYVIFIKGLITHGYENFIHDHPGVIICNGGIPELKEILLTLACK